MEMFLTLDVPNIWGWHELVQGVFHIEIRSLYVKCHQMFNENGAENNYNLTIPVGDKIKMSVQLWWFKFAGQI